MSLRNRQRIDYNLLNKGIHRTMSDNNQNAGASALAQTDETKTDSAEKFEESFSERVDVVGARITELENELKALELEEKRKKLEQAIREKKAAISQLSSQETLHHQQQQQQQQQQHQHQEQTTAGTGSQQQQQTAVNLGELYSNNNPNLQGLGIQAKHSIPPGTTPKSADYAYGENLRLDLNPQCYLYSPNDPKRGKHRSIIDFIPTMARRSMEQREEVHEIAPEIKMLVGNQQKLDSVTPAQWVAANACILADIVKSAPPQVDIRQLVCDYQSYTVKIGELACVYTWKSVIHYDDEYREKQHLHQYRWGSDSTHLRTHLVLRKEIDREKDKKSKTSGHLREQKQQLKFCFDWNKGDCSRENCLFKHACEWCKSAAHPRVKHDEAAKA